MTTSEEYKALQQWAFHIEPCFTYDGQSWTAAYPNADWSVSAPTEEEVRDRLGAEFIQRQNVGEDDLAYGNAVMLRHLREPVPGMYAMPNEVYLELKDEPRADMDRAFKEAEAKRVRGETYTKDDYLRGRDS